MVSWDDGPVRLKYALDCGAEFVVEGVLNSELEHTVRPACTVPNFPHFPRGSWCIYIGRCWSL